MDPDVDQLVREQRLVAARTVAYHLVGVQQQARKSRNKVVEKGGRSVTQRGLEPRWKFLMWWWQCHTVSQWQSCS